MNKRKRLRRTWPALFLAAIAASFSDVGSAADPNGAVNADVTVAAAAACIDLSATSISFGTLPLGAENQPATPAIRSRTASAGWCSRARPTSGRAGRIRCRCLQESLRKGCLVG